IAVFALIKLSIMGSGSHERTSGPIFETNGADFMRFREFVYTQHTVGGTIQKGGKGAEPWASAAGMLSCERLT
ncbi:MAG: hypothetical protein WBE86_15320, partial [Candidatus Acidiferrales bacterium]